MHYSYTEKKPIDDKQFGCIRVFVFEDEPYNDLIEKCKYYASPGSFHVSGAEFNVGDSGAMEIALVVSW